MFYGFQFRGKPGTLKGKPHYLTGKRNISGQLYIFKTRIELINWDNAGPKRIITTKREAKDLYFGGLGQSEYEAIIYSLKSKL